MSYYFTSVTFNPFYITAAPFVENLFLTQYNTQLKIVLAMQWTTNEFRVNKHFKILCYWCRDLPYLPANTSRPIAANCIGSHSRLLANRVSSRTKLLLSFRITSSSGATKINLENGSFLFFCQIRKKHGFTRGLKRVFHTARKIIWCNLDVFSWFMLSVEGNSL